MRWHHDVWPSWYGFYEALGLYEEKDRELLAWVDNRSLTPLNRDLFAKFINERVDTDSRCAEIEKRYITWLLKN